MATAKSQRKDMVRLSKALSWILRHGAHNEGIPMTAEGFVYVSDLLQHEKFNSYTENDIKSVVEQNDKQRFALTLHDNSRLMIRANQGHSVEVENLELIELGPTDLKEVIHGTYNHCIGAIKQEGLKVMRRQYIHMAQGMPGQNGVVSGMRKSCDVIIFVNVTKAMNDGIKFYRSANNVILTKGNDQGCLPPKYFNKFLDRI